MGLFRDKSLEGAIIAYEEALALFGKLDTSLGNRYRLTNLANIGAAYREAGKLDKARTSLERAVEGWQGLEEKKWVAFARALQDLGLTEQVSGRLAEAEEHLVASLETYGEIPNPGESVIAFQQETIDA